MMYSTLSTFLISHSIQQICLLILALLMAVDAAPLKQFSTLEGVNFGYPINTPMHYYYVPIFLPYSSHNQLIDDSAVPAFEFDGPSGIEYKQYLSDRILFGLFGSSDLDSVEIYASPFQEFINRVFFGGQFRPNRLWGFITGSKPVTSAVSSNFPGISSGSTVDNENESVIIET